MALRLIEMVLFEQFKEELDRLLDKYDFLDLWQERIDNNRVHIKFVLPTERTEEILNLLEKRFAGTEGFRIILLPVEASVPKLIIEEKPESGVTSQDTGKKSALKRTRISRAEMYSEAEKTTHFSWIFILLTILSSLVASIGILRNNVVFIIGAMVIAPVLGPSMALALATTLGDFDLSRKAIKAISAGILVAFGFSVFLGLGLNVDTAVPELLSRTAVNYSDVVLALAAGSAAALSLTTGLLSALIGVMVAVALLPPLVTTGMLIGSGHWDLALGSFLLFLTNFICVNLSGVITFIMQGFRPLTWWEADKAKKAAFRAILLWSLFLLALILVIFFSSKS
jgi:uncharacterized hydrophobic protein (TIGR00341 family)